jgi:hypothetical protein
VSQIEQCGPRYALRRNDAIQLARMIIRDVGHMGEVISARTATQLAVRVNRLRAGDPSANIYAVRSKSCEQASWSTPYVKGDFRREPSHQFRCIPSLCNFYKAPEQASRNVSFTLAKSCNFRKLAPHECPDSEVRKQLRHTLMRT